MRLPDKHDIYHDNREIYSCLFRVASQALSTIVMVVGKWTKKKNPIATGKKETPLFKVKTNQVRRPIEMMNAETLLIDENWI